MYNLQTIGTPISYTKCMKLEKLFVIGWLMHKQPFQLLSLYCRRWSASEVCLYGINYAHLRLCLQTWCFQTRKPTPIDRHVCIMYAAIEYASSIRCKGMKESSIQRHVVVCQPIAIELLPCHVLPHHRSSSQVSYIGKHNCVVKSVFF